MTPLRRTSIVVTAAALSLAPPSLPPAIADPGPRSATPGSSIANADSNDPKRLIYHQSMTLGRRSFQRGHGDRSREYYTFAMEMAWRFQPREHFPFEELGDVLAESGQLPEAAHAYMQALEILHAQKDASNKEIIARVERKLGLLPEDARRGARPLVEPPKDLGAELRFPEPLAREDEEKSAELKRPSLGEQRPEPRFQRPLRPESRPGAGAPWIDFGRSEANLFAGAVGFSDDFFADPSLSGGLLYRAPAPIVPLSNVGVFGELVVSTLDRNILPKPSTASGTILFLGVGADYTFFRNEDWFLTGQGGLMYGNFGGITDLDDGISALVGVAGGINIESGFWLTYNPQIALAGTDLFVVFHNFGIQIEF